MHNIHVKPELIRPRQGTSIGVIAPANSMADLSRGLIDTGKRRFQELGFNVKIGSNALGRQGHVLSIDQRLSDLAEMLEDPDVSIIMPVFGGYNSIDLLKQLPIKEIKTKQKLFIGYSDITALLVVINKLTGLPTFHGPGFSNFCELNMHDYTLRSFLEAITCSGEFVIQDPCTASDELWYKLPATAHRQYYPSKWLIFNPGVASAPLVGGNTDTLLALAGTPFFPNCRGSILLLEENIGTLPGRVDRNFAQLALMGVFDQIRGLIIGKQEKNSEFWIRELLVKHCSGFTYPIIYNVNCSHTDPIMTIPLGTYIHIDTEKLTIQYKLHYAEEVSSIH